jgi:hypothetical protein
MTQIVRDAESDARETVGPTGDTQTASGAVTQGEME